MCVYIYIYYIYIYIIYIYIYIYIYIIHNSQKELKHSFWFRDFRNTQDIRTQCFKYFLSIYLIQSHQNHKKKET